MQADEQHDNEGHHVAQNELGESLPDFARLDSATGAFDLVHQITARMKAQTPMKMSMNIFTVVAVMSIQPSL